MLCCIFKDYSYICSQNSVLQKRPTVIIAATFDELKARLQ